MVDVETFICKVSTGEYLCERVGSRMAAGDMKQLKAETRSVDSRSTMDSASSVLGGGQQRLKRLLRKELIVLITAYNKIP